MVNVAKQAVRSRFAKAAMSSGLTRSERINNSCPVHPNDAEERTRTAQAGGRGTASSEAVDAGLVLLFAEEFQSLPSVFVFDSDTVFVGRSAGNIVIPQSAVSRMHAQIVRSPQGFVIRDLRSRNGLFVGGRRVEESALQPNDEVRIGDAIFKFVPQGARAYAPYRLDGSTEADAKRVTIPDAVGGLQMARLSAELETVAAADMPVLVLGETGTGKELVARALHAQSGRPGPFCALNCASIPPNLVESELFGFKRGAFSGATRDHPGIIRSANGGTLLLDEIGDMPLEAQAKLLRTLETREVVPVGAVTTTRVDVRIVGATHRDLRALVEAGSFRGDLFARLNGYALRLPALRERKEDLYVLVRHFLRKAGAADRRLAFGFMRCICHYAWPFNVRELAGAVKRAVAVSEGGPLTESHLPSEVTEYMHAASQSPAPLPVPGAAQAPTPSADELSEMLRQHRGNVSAVARILGKDRVQIHRWMRKYGIDPTIFR